MSRKFILPTNEARFNVTYPDYGHLPEPVRELAEAIHDSTQELLGSLALDDAATYIHRKNLFIGTPRGISIRNIERETRDTPGGVSILGMYGGAGFIMREHSNARVGWRFRHFETYDIPQPKSVLRSREFTKSQEWMRDVGRKTFGFRLYTSNRDPLFHCPLEVAVPSIETQAADLRELPENLLPKVSEAISSLDLITKATS